VSRILKGVFLGLGSALSTIILLAAALMLCAKGMPLIAALVIAIGTILGVAIAWILAKRLPARVAAGIAVAVAASITTGLAIAEKTLQESVGISLLTGPMMLSGVAIVVADRTVLMLENGMAHREASRTAAILSTGVTLLSGGITTTQMLGGKGIAWQISVWLGSMTGAVLIAWLMLVMFLSLFGEKKSFDQNDNATFSIAASLPWLRRHPDLIIEVEACLSRTRKTKTGWHLKFEIFRRLTDVSLAALTIDIQKILKEIGLSL
jgi:hypothetical protein